MTKSRPKKQPKAISKLNRLDVAILIVYALAGLFVGFCDWVVSKIRK